MHLPVIATLAVADSPPWPPRMFATCLTCPRRGRGLQNLTRNRRSSKRGLVSARLVVDLQVRELTQCRGYHARALRAARRESTSNRHPREQIQRTAKMDEQNESPPMVGFMLLGLRYYCASADAFFFLNQADDAFHKQRSFRRPCSSSLAETAGYRQPTSAGGRDGFR